MISFWIAALIALYFYQQLRQNKIKANVTAARMMLYELRDELRDLAISGTIDKRSWLFAYLDSTLARTIRNMPSISAWNTIMIWLYYRREPRFVAMTRQLVLELRRERNAEFARIHKEHVLIIYGFLSMRHPVAYFLAVAALKGLIAVLWGLEFLIRVSADQVRLRLKREVDLAVEAQTEAPETSTLFDYVPAPADAESA